MRLTQSNLSSTSFKKESIQKRRAKKRFNAALLALNSDYVLRKRLITLIVLEECYMQDKVTALPLLLSIFEDANDNVKKGGSTFELVPAYIAFMIAAQEKYSFTTISPSILPNEITCLFTSSMDSLLAEDQAAHTTLADYVKSNGTMFFLSSPVQSKTDALLLYLAHKLDPFTLFIVKVSLSHTYDKL